MNFESLKLGFKEYLRKNMDLSEERYELDSSDVSIFMYTSEFKNYLRDELNCDLSFAGINMSKLSKMEVVDGKLVNPDEVEEKTNKKGKNEHLIRYENGEIIFNSKTSDKSEDDLNPEEILKSPEENTSENSILNLLEEGDEAKLPTAEDEINIEEMDLVTNIINELLQDEQFKEIVDRDGDDEVQTEELMDFFESIKENDKNKKDVSLDDIIQATEDIEEGEFEFSEEVLKEDAKEANAANSAGGGGGGGGGSSAGGSSVSPSSAQNTEKTLEQMTPGEIQGKIDEEQSVLDQNQDLLTSVIDGSCDEVKQVQDEADKAYEEYLEALEEKAPDLAKKVDDLKTDIDTQKQAIAEIDVKIVEQEQTVFEAENTYESAKSKVANLNSIKSALQGELSGADDESKGEIQEKLNALESDIASAEAEEKEALENLEAQKKELESLKENKETEETALDKLNEQMEELELEVEALEDDTIMDLKATWEESEAAVEELKTTAIDEINKAVSTSRDNIQQYQVAKTEAENREAQKEYSLNSVGEDAVAKAKEFLGYNEADGSADIFMQEYGYTSGTPWCAGFVAYCLKNSGSYDQVPDWYKNIDNKLYCPTVLNAAQNAGALISADEVQQGDIMIFENQGHIGIIDRIEDGYLYTIEGNTSNAVKEKKYPLNSQNFYFLKIT